MKGLQKKTVMSIAVFALVASMIPQIFAKAEGIEWGPYNITSGYVKTVKMTPETAELFTDYEGNPISDTSVIIVTRDFTLDLDFDRVGWAKSDFDFTMSVPGNWDWNGNYPPSIREAQFCYYDEGEIGQGGGCHYDLFGIENGNYRVIGRLDSDNPQDPYWSADDYDDYGTSRTNGAIFRIESDNKLTNQHFEQYFLFDFQLEGHLLSFTEEPAGDTGRAPFEAAAEGTVYRLYNPTDGDHIYTVNAEEAKGLYDAGWDLETSPGMTSGEDGVPIYRLTNDASREHMFTADKREKNKLSKNGWTVDNGGEPVFYGAESGRAMYRLFNPNASSAVQSHNFTLDKNEIRQLTTNYGWQVDNGGEPVFYLN